MLATSLQSFEKENIAKIERNQSQVETIGNQQQMIKTELNSINQEVSQGVVRQDEAEQSFLQSF